MGYTKIIQRFKGIEHLNVNYSWDLGIEMLPHTETSPVTWRETRSRCCPVGNKPHLDAIIDPCGAVMVFLYIDIERLISDQICRDNNIITSYNIVGLVHSSTLKALNFFL